MPFLTNIGWKAIFSAIAVFLVLGYITYLNLALSHARNDLQKAKNEHAAYVLQIDREATNQRVLNLQREAKQNKITIDTALGYNDALERQRKYYASHPVTKLVTSSVRQPATNDTGTVPTTPQGSTSVDEGAANDQSGEAGESTTVEDCATTTIQLLWLQDWVRKQGM